MTKSRRFFGIPLIIIFLVLIALIAGGGYHTYQYTSSDRYCASCHVHPQATKSWMKSKHYGDTIRAHCVDCHLPPNDGVNHYTEKVRTGIRDVFAYHFEDSSEYNWAYKSQLDKAVNHTYKSSCVKCHDNLFEMDQSKEADEAHLYYSYHKDELHCINCHIDAGHFSETEHKKNLSFLHVKSVDTVYVEPTCVKGFGIFTELIPGTSVSFTMQPIPGGNFRMGTERESLFLEQDELPIRNIHVDSFYMGRVEVSWDEYLAFLTTTESEGRAIPDIDKPIETDAISGATPPWGDPSQGWGMGQRPAITMTHHAAQVYCMWLSQKTGKKYRLPTEAEWEYACRAGSQSDYFFEADAKMSQEKKGIRSWFSNQQSDSIRRYVIYERNSSNMTHEPFSVESNSFGLVNMLGNVKEFCSDYYHPQAYSRTADNIENPTGPQHGTEYVIRGGSFSSSFDQVRCASREQTHHDIWLKTDPQIPKSIWWYSDCNDVGFRVVCEYNKDSGKGGDDE